MTLSQIIKEAYPELTDLDFSFNNLIKLQNDSDGAGDYIREWNYSKPIPEGLTLGKPVA